MKSEDLKSFINLYFQNVQGSNVKMFSFRTWFFVVHGTWNNFLSFSFFNFYSRPPSISQLAKQVKKNIYDKSFSKTKSAHLLKFQMALASKCNSVNYIVSLYLRTSYVFKSNVLQISVIADLLRPSWSTPRWISSSSSFDGFNT